MRDAVRVREAVRVRVGVRVRVPSTRVGVEFPSSVAVLVAVCVAVSVAAAAVVAFGVVLGVAVPTDVPVGVAASSGVEVALALSVSVGDAVPAEAVGVTVAGVPVVVGDGVVETCGQPLRALPTAATSSSTVTRRSLFVSAGEHCSSEAASVAMLVAVTNSLMRTTRSALQSPPQTATLPPAMPAPGAVVSPLRCASARCGAADSPAANANTTPAVRIQSSQLSILIPRP